jgi:hypothetical protein
VRTEAFPLRVRIPAGVCGLARDSDVLAPLEFLDLV